MKVLVCGGRFYANGDKVFAVLDEMHRQRPITEIIQGGASGADMHANHWACKNKIWCTEVLAMWKAYGRRAGPIRNAKMLEFKPDIVIAFPGGKGTANMIKQACDAGIPISEIEP